MKTLILGGADDLAERLAEEIRRFDIEVDTLAINPNPELGEELFPFPIVINASSFDCSSLASFCLKENIVFIETQSIEKNIKKLKGLDIDKPSGTIVLGGGAYTGLGNLLRAFLQADDATLSISPASLGKARKIDVGFYVADADRTHPFFRFFANLFSPPVNTTPALVASRDDKVASLTMSDVDKCGGLSLGAMILEIIEGRDVPTGVHFIHDVFFLESNISLIDAIAPDALVAKLP